MSARSIVIAFVAIELLAIVAWLASVAGAPSALYIAIAVVEVAIGGAVFMELAAAHPVQRVAAATLVFILALLCSGVAGDVAMR